MDESHHLVIMYLKTTTFGSSFAHCFKIMQLAGRMSSSSITAQNMDMDKVDQVLLGGNYTHRAVPFSG